jgi:large conductance mechanosensitive channel
MKAFLEFVREKGVLGLAIGIIMGGAVTQFVNAIVIDLLNPLIGSITGSGGSLNLLSYTVPYTHITFLWGAFLSSFINFIMILAVVYFVFTKLPVLSDLDKKKEEDK